MDSIAWGCTVWISTSVPTSYVDLFSVFRTESCNSKPLTYPHRLPDLEFTSVCIGSAWFPGRSEM